MKKLSLLLSTMILMSTVGFSAFAATEDTGFEDVSADYKYAEGIKYCVDNSIIKRTSVTEFSPEEHMNRELLACVLYRLEESPAATSDITFDDVATGRWFQTGVIWAAESNILVGYGNGLFGVNDGLTKEQFATALWRYIGSPAASGNSNYTDADIISEWAKTPVLWAEQNNILNSGNNRFEPQSLVKRGMAADAIMNFLAIKETPYMTNIANNIVSDLPQGEFIDKIKMTIEGVEGEAIVSLIDSKPTREFIAQLPMTVNFTDFGDREKFGRMPIAISEDEALLSDYEIGDFSYGAPYDCMIMFYAQDNEVIDGIIKMGTFDSGLELFTGKENINVTIEALK